MPAIRKEEFEYVHIPSASGRRLHIVDPAETETLCSRPLPIHLGPFANWPEGWDVLQFFEVDPQEVPCQNCIRIQRARLRALHEADVLRQIREGQAEESARALEGLWVSLLRVHGAVDAWNATGAHTAQTIQEALKCLEKVRKGE